jgi:FkbM family methyltransferase
MQTLMSKINFITNLDDLIDPVYTSKFEIFVDNLLQVLYQHVYDTNQNHVMIDVGANIGTITKILLRHIDQASGKVIAIDAHPRWLEQFEFFNHPQVETHNLGCYSYTCEKKFIAENELTGVGYFGLCPDKTHLNVDKLTSSLIRCETLDNLVATDNKISFIKIDAESSDFEVLLGGKNILMKNRPFVVFEFSGQILERAHGHSRTDFFDFFKTHQYNLYSVGQGKTQDYLAQSWDTFTSECQDILAVPAEYDHLVENNNILEKT